MVAVVPVVLFHAGVPMIGGGYVGVDVFFVISGFLITSIIKRELDDGRFSLLTFYERRARRILPALAFMVALTIAVSTLALLPTAMERLGHSVVATALFASNFYFWQTLGYFSPDAEFEPLLHTWSLAVEEQFYILYPPLLMVIFATPLRRRLATILLVLAIGSLGASIAAVAFRPTAAFYLLPFRAWELGLGALLAVSSLPNIRSVPLREAAGALALLAIVVPVFAYTSTTPFPGLAALPPVLGTALLIHLGQNKNMVSTLLSVRPIVAIGLISYSLYLWHWPALALFRANKGSIHLSAFEASAAVVLSVALAWISYRYVETPFRRRKLFAQRRSILSGAIVAIVILSLLGVSLDLLKGLPQRVPERALQAEAGAQDRNPYRPPCLGRRAGQGWCVIGAGIGGYEIESGRADALLWGDSHADALVPAVEMAAEANGLTVAIATLRACAPIVRMGRVNSSRSSKCLSFNESAFNKVLASDNFPTVILAARWALYVEGSRFGEEAGEDVILQWADPMKPIEPMPVGNPAIFEEALDQTVQALRASGREVIVLGPTPEIGWNVPTKLSVQIWKGREEPLGPERERVQARTNRTIEILRSVAERHGARYVDLLDPVCSDRCRLWIDDAPAFVDDDHLSATAARELLAPVLTAELQRLDQSRIRADRWSLTGG